MYGLYGVQHELLVTFFFLKKELRRQNPWKWRQRRQRPPRASKWGYFNCRTGNGDASPLLGRPRGKIFKQSFFTVEVTTELMSFCQFRQRLNERPITFNMSIYRNRMKVPENFDGYVQNYVLYAINWIRFPPLVRRGSEV